HADLAADRAVHLGQQRRRNVDERDAAQVRGRRIAGHVADDAAAERDQRRAAVGGRLHERVVDARDGRQLLGAFAVRHEDRLDLFRAAREALAVQPPHERARDDEAARGQFELVEQCADAIENAVFEMYGVAARGRGNVYADQDRVVGLPFVYLSPDVVVIGGGIAGL